MAQAHQDKQLLVCLSRGDRLIRQDPYWDAVPKTSVRRAQQKLCRDPSHAEDKGSSLPRTAGPPPRRTARCSTPTECRMHMGHAGHTQPNRAQKSNPPRNPQQEPRKGGRPTRRGIPRKPPGDLREPRFGRSHPFFFKQWPIRPVLGAAKLCSLRFEATGSRGVLKQGGDQNEQRTPKRETPQHLPPPKTGPEAPKSRWGVNILRHLQKGSETRPSGSHPSRSPPLPPSGWPPTLTSPGCSG